MFNPKNLEKLQKLPAQKLPIFSIFLKTDRKTEPFEKVKITLKNLLKKQEKNFQTHAEKKSFKKICGQITNYVEQNAPLANYHGLAIFAGGDKNLFEIIELSLIPKTVQNTLVLDQKPFLDIFDFFNKKFKKFALFLTNERLAKIFLAQGNDILNLSESELKIGRKTDREGIFRSGKGSAGGGTAENINEKEMDLRRYFKKILAELQKNCLEEKVNALILAAPAKILPIVEKELSKPLEKMIVAKWSLDLTKQDEVTLLNKIKDFEKANQ